MISFHQLRLGKELGVDPKVILATSHGRRSIDTIKLYDPSRANWECEFTYLTISFAFVSPLFAILERKMGCLIGDWLLFIRLYFVLNHQMSIT